MTEQLDMIFNPRKHSRRSDPSTSKDAAETMTHAAPSLCDRILLALKTFGSMTQTEIADVMRRRYHVNVDRQQVNKRTADLKNAGKIEASGETRPGPSGREQIVWRSV